MSKKYVKRILASKRAMELEWHRQGFAIGEKWAKNEATYHMLNDLNEQREGYGASYWAGYFDEDELEDYVYPKSCFTTMIGISREHCEKFWDKVLTDNNRRMADRGAFVRGFAEGALEVFAAVRQQMES